MGSEKFVTDLQPDVEIVISSIGGDLQLEGSIEAGMKVRGDNPRLSVDNDGHRDLWQPYDAVGSVAHYFSQHGWQLHSVVTQPAPPSDDPEVIELGASDGSEYWRIYPNFKVIKKYNNSNKYAMAVHQLAQAIKQRYN